MSVIQCYSQCFYVVHVAFIVFLHIDKFFVFVPLSEYKHFKHVLILNVFEDKVIQVENFEEVGG